MILIEILDSPNFDQKGEYKFFFDQVLIGHNNEDIILKDDSTKGLSFRLSIAKKGIKISLSDENFEYKVNNKSILGEKIILKGDTFQFGPTLFVLKDFLISEKDIIDKIKENIDEIDELPREHKSLINTIETTLEKL